MRVMTPADAISSSDREQLPEHPADSGMLCIPGGTFLMGSDRHYPEEAPVHRVTVDGFWMDRTPVTNRQFRQFVEATGYVTFAETAPDPKDYPGALPHMLKAGSLAFAPPKRRVDLSNWGDWWTFKFGANWRRPYGPGSSIRGLDEHPVVHVAFKDAEAYAQWAGKQPLATYYRSTIMPKNGSTPMGYRRAKGQWCSASSFFFMRQRRNSRYTYRCAPETCNQCHASRRR
jgi:sulfatase modifying factor 1